MTFEERVARLDAIVEELQESELPLSRALTLFEEGIACLREASGELAAAETLVQRLTERADGGVDLTDLRV